MPTTTTWKSAMTSIATLKRLPATKLSELLLAEKSGDPTVAVIDVRDDDYIGGHIKGSMNFPSRSFETMLPTILRKLENKKTVIFHCALSQQRGPSAALRYMREREQKFGSASLAGGAAAAKAEGPTDEKPQVQQDVFVLDRGFCGWQEVYGENTDLTEGYRKEIWEDGY